MLVAFSLIVVIVLGVLVSLGINGTSSGEFYSQVSTGRDPNLLLGSPQIVRTDEWNVQTVWAIAQAQQGLPAINHTFPGGMDTTIPQDLPRRDWTEAFRPHLWGFLFLDVGHAQAWKWWFPAAGVLIAAFFFFATVLPRRPGVAALLSVGFFYSPIIQWWYLETTLWPVAWAFAVMAGAIWMLRSKKAGVRWIWAAVIAYLTVVMAMGIYVPYIQPAALVVLAFLVVLIVREWRTIRADGGAALQVIAVRLSPLVAGAAAAGAISIVWLATRLAVVDAFLGTAYPGARSTSTGGGHLTGLLSLLASPFTGALNGEAPGGMGVNSSEASTAFYVGAFLIPAAVFCVVHSVKNRIRLPWEILGFTAAIALFMAFIYLPGWNLLARLLLFNETTENRVRLGIAIASIGLLVYLIAYLDEHRMRIRRWFALALGGAYVLLELAIAYALWRGSPHVLQVTRLWPLWVLLSAATLVLFARRRVRLATVCLTIVAVAGSGLTNPFYRGVVDLRTTDVAKAIMKIDKQDPDATWVGIGDRLETALLLESGAQAYNGFQGAPNHKMWRTIDPAGKYEFEWNRLAGVSWQFGSGAPVISNPAADQILVSFDACSRFASSHVEYVLSDRTPPASSCLVEESSFSLPGSTVKIYRVSASG